MPTGTLSVLRFKPASPALFTSQATSAKEVVQEDTSHDVTPAFPSPHHLKWMAGGVVGLLALWALYHKATKHPETGLFRGIRAANIPFLSTLNFPDTGLSLIDITSTGMTSVNSLSRILFGFATKQHQFEVFGSELLTRIGTLGLIKVVKGEKSLFSLDRWFLQYLMKPRSRRLTRIIQEPKEKHWWLRFQSTWRNTIGLRVQRHMGLNTPFELMVPRLRKVPKTVGTLESVVIDATRKRLTLAESEEVLHLRLQKAVEIMENYQRQEQGFQQTWQATQDPKALTQAYEDLATVQYDYNHFFHDDRYLKIQKTGVDPWVGRHHYEHYKEKMEQLTGKAFSIEGLSQRAKRLCWGITAEKEQKNGLVFPLNKNPKIDWQKELVQLGGSTIEKQLQILRDELKGGVLLGPLKDKIDTVLLLKDGTPGLPDSVKLAQRMKDIFEPYLEELMKYYRHDDTEHQEKWKILHAKYPDLKKPFEVFPLSEAGIQSLLNCLREADEAIRPKTPLYDPRPMAVAKAMDASLPKISAKEQLKRYKKRVHAHLETYIEALKESQSLPYKYYTDQAKKSYDVVIQNAVSDYLQKRSTENAHNSAPTMGFYLAQHLATARRLDLNSRKGAQFTGAAFDIMDAAFHLNERIADLDQYKRNNLLKASVQVAFQTIVTSFVLSNVLFFIVYNSFSRLDPDYKGQGKIPLSDFVQHLKSIFLPRDAQANHAPTESKKPFEATVNLSVNFKEGLNPFRPAIDKASQKNTLANTPVEGDE
jgi:hypothetical protein